MTSRTIVLPLGMSLAVLLLPPPVRGDEPTPGPALPTPRAPELAATKRPPARVYTNDDLDRVRPFRDETGGRSVPAFSPAESRSSRSGEDRPRARGEAYWREEARRVRERVADLAAKADELRAQLAAAEDEERHFTRSSRSGRSPASLSGGSRATTQARLAALALRIRALEDDLADRARREGALPGWLR